MQFDALAFLFLKFYLYDLNQLCIIFSCIVVLHLEVQVPQNKQLSISAASTQTYWEPHFADCEEKLVLQGDVFAIYHHQDLSTSEPPVSPRKIYVSPHLLLFLQSCLTPGHQVINLCQMLVLRGVLLTHRTR